MNRRPVIQDSKQTGKNCSSIDRAHLESWDFNLDASVLAGMSSVPSELPEFAHDTHTPPLPSESEVKSHPRATRNCKPKVARALQERV